MLIIHKGEVISHRAVIVLKVDQDESKQKQVREKGLTSIE